MMDGYLLDTNVVSVLANSRNLRHAEFKQKLGNLQHVWLPVVAIAEIESGMAKTDRPDETQRDEIRRFFREYPQHLGIGDNTVEPYALLRGQLWRMHATREKRGHKEKLPEELFDKVTGKQLGIDERDLFIASVAAENGLILATNDSNAGMKRIEEAAQQLQEAGKAVNLKISYW
jgi:predicted nucleic acid-binding protein